MNPKRLKVTYSTTESLGGFREGGYRGLKHGQKDMLEVDLNDRPFLEPGFRAYYSGDQNSSRTFDQPNKISAPS